MNSSTRLTPVFDCDEALAAHRQFSGGRELVPFFDKDDIRSFDDWQHRLQHSLAASRLFVVFLSPNYFASEWCRREWRMWIDVAFAKHVPADGAAPLYMVEVPGLLSDMNKYEVARQVVALCEPLDDSNRSGVSRQVIES